jgi:hypothetical protein
VCRFLIIIQSRKKKLQNNFAISSSCAMNRMCKSKIAEKISGISV